MSGAVGLQSGRGRNGGVFASCFTLEGELVTHAPDQDLGEFISGLAVVISLLYLAAQIRQNTRSLRAQADDDTRKQMFRLNELMLNNREIAQLAIAGSTRPDSLDTADTVRFGYLLMNTFLSIESVYLKSHAGLLELERWPVYEVQLGNLVRFPGVRAWWEATDRGFHSGFSEMVGRLVQNAADAHARGEASE